MFKRLLIANRGEIACRIIKTAKQLGIHTIVVYADADRHSLAVTNADEAYYLGESPALLSYLNREAIIAIAKQAKACAIHPGYGFLSEQPEFAAAVTQAGIVFIGPPVAAMALMASKQTAKLWVEKNTQIPCIPGYHGDDQSDEALLKAAKGIGFPLLLKAAHGGGGKGLRRVTDIGGFLTALAEARREALSAFGNADMILEKWLAQPRHIEIQVIADKQGQVRHLFERDCSVQRRHQKIIEEAGAPHLSEQLRRQLTDSACQITSAIGYEGVGTLEFLVDASSGQYYFLEMNTRLQVEHPVTECITGLDLVALQLRVAYGEALDIEQTDIIRQGHAIECRICAEDPAEDYRPVTGDITAFSFSPQLHLRVDTGITVGSVITPYYDSLLAKVITWGETREMAIARMRQALGSCEIGGITTNLPLLRQLCDEAKFIAGDTDTQWLNTLTYTPPDPHLSILFVAMHDYITLVRNTTYPNPWFAWRMYQQASHWQWVYHVAQSISIVDVQPLTNDSALITLNGQSYPIITLQSAPRFMIDVAGVVHHAFMEDKSAECIVHSQQGIVRVLKIGDKARANTLVSKGSLIAPLPAIVVALLKQPGDTVAEGEPLMILEAMKMEHSIRAPHPGILTRYCWQVGDQVTEGSQLVILTADEADE